MIFQRTDGTSRVPRALQDAATSWIEEHWDGPEALAMQLPTGVGKSWLARMVQKNTGAFVIVPNNILMDDTYTSVYPDVNSLKGKARYTCSNHGGLTCADVTGALKKKACADCPYSLRRKAALRKEPTFFNPMSLFYLQKAEQYQRPDVIIVDEAHQLRDMLMLISAKTFRQGKYNFPDTTSDHDITVWMRGQLDTLHTLFQRALASDSPDTDKVEELSREIEGIQNALWGLQENPQNYAIYVTVGTYRGKPEKYLNVTPLEPPRFLVKQLLDCKKLILLSATLSRMDVETLLKGKPYKYLDMPSPIDKGRRTICYQPTKFPMNYKTDPADIVAHVEAVIAKYPGVNTMIHASYSLAEKMRPHFTIPVITHGVQDKNAALETFKQKGGVFLASGFAEGVDLKGDLCRLNIVPMLQRLNPFDPAVKKRSAWADGELWYDLETLKTLIQQCGRSTRGEDDWSTIVVCDPAFPRLVTKNKAHVPKSFLEAISWVGKPFKREGAA